MKRHAIQRWHARMLDKPWYFVLSGVCMALVVATTLLGLLFLAVRYL